MAHLRRVIEETGSQLNISDDQVELFCKNSPFIKVIRYRSIEDEIRRPKHVLIQQALSEDQTSENNIIWYVLLRAADEFRHQRKRFPGMSLLKSDGEQFILQITGSMDGEVESDIGGLKKIITALLSTWSVNLTGGTCLPDDYVHEM
jgi:amyloid beta precursor protein binding protein 1